jgi:hypothetical protein
MSEAPGQVLIREILRRKNLLRCPDNLIRKMPADRVCFSLFTKYQANNPGRFDLFTRATGDKGGNTVLLDLVQQIAMKRQIQGTGQRAAGKKNTGSRRRH